MGGFVYPVALSPVCAGAGLGNPVISNDRIPCVGLYIKTIAFLLAAIVQDFIFFERVAMAAVLESLLPEVDSTESILSDCVIDKQIVCVFVADGNTIFPIILNYIVLELSMANAPAQE